MNSTPPEEPFWNIVRHAEPPGWQGHRRAGDSRLVTACPIQRAYPWMLFASTGVAALFCFMYISKPVVETLSGPLVPMEPTAARAAVTESPAAVAPAEPAESLNPAESIDLAESAELADLAIPPLLPPGDRLPGEPTAALAAVAPPAIAGRTMPPPAADSPYEETNMRIQHVLSAETVDGAQSRIILDVPVLYESRQLRWTDRETREARELLNRLVEHQEKTHALRDEGAVLLETWNAMIERSIPTTELRADSPTLPANQSAAASSPRPSGLDTGEAIRIQTPHER